MNITISYWFFQVKMDLKNTTSANMKYPEEVNPQTESRQMVAWGWVGEEKRRTMQHEAGDKYFLKLTEVVIQ